MVDLPIKNHLFKGMFLAPPLKLPYHPDAKGGGYSPYYSPFAKVLAEPGLVNPFGILQQELGNLVCIMLQQSHTHKVFDTLHTQKLPLATAKKGIVMMHEPSPG